MATRFLMNARGSARYSSVSRMPVMPTLPGGSWKRERDRERGGISLLEPGRRREGGERERGGEGEGEGWREGERERDREMEREWERDRE